MKVLPEQLRLYAVTDSRHLQGRTLLETVSAALDGGATFVQLRDKDCSPAELLAEARALAALCHTRGVPFVVDDDVEVALASGADGVHVGQSDMAARRARALLGPDKILLPTSKMDVFVVAKKSILDISYAEMVKQLIYMFNKLNIENKGAKL